MKCIFDSCELVNGIVLGIVSSAFFAFLFHFLREYFYFKRRYGKFAGKFKGYDLENHPLSNAIITHTAENRLEISVTHGHLTWIGEITMNSLRYGSIVFQYEDREARHFFGFKKVVAEKDFNTIYVIGDESKGYGTEVFKRA
ncbi:MAG: hypothetical protein ACHQF4_09370 [Sphingobacteriales bacterium]